MRNFISTAYLVQIDGLSSRMTLRNASLQLGVIINLTTRARTLTVKSIYN
jgi:hypothetical protein